MRDEGKRRGKLPVMKYDTAKVSVQEDYWM